MRRVNVGWFGRAGLGAILLGLITAQVAAAVPVVIASIAVGRGREGVAVNPATHRAYVTNAPVILVR